MDRQHALTAMPFHCAFLKPHPQPHPPLSSPLSSHTNLQADLKYQTSLSHEPILAPWYNPKHPRPDIPSSALFTLNHQRTQYITRELERWNATAATTSTGRPFDAIISPVTPGPAFGHDEFQYAYTGWVNLADYASVAFPVTTADGAMDGWGVGEGEGEGEGGADGGWGEEEKKVWDACKLPFMRLRGCNGFFVGILVRGRFSEAEGRARGGMYCPRAHVFLLEKATSCVPWVRRS